jgi:hypothetical protein
VAAIERVEVQQDVRETRSGKDTPFQAALRPHEQHVYVGAGCSQRAGDGQRWVEMATSPSAAEKDEH